MNRPLLEIDGFGLAVPVDDGEKTIVHDVSMHVDAGGSLGLVGESGSGKSITLRAAIGLGPAGAVTRGDIRFEGTSVSSMTPAQLSRYRSQDVAMIFQDPRAHINPVRTIGDFLCEGLTLTRRVPRRDAERQAATLLDDVGVSHARRRLAQHPHELSGGLLQRVMIASALLTNPRLLLADEPTTALDVTTQEEVMAIIDEQRRERSLALVFVTHDLDLAGAVCDRLAVMQGGRIVETVPALRARELATEPYTRALLSARVPFGDVPGTTGGGSPS